jgi:hypothetical protein
LWLIGNVERHLTLHCLSTIKSLSLVMAFVWQKSLHFPFKFFIVFPLSHVFCHLKAALDSFTNAASRSVLFKTRLVKTCFYSTIF